MTTLGAESGPRLRFWGLPSKRGRHVTWVPGGWAAFWSGLTIFVLGRDRINSQYAGWQQQYAAYFGVGPKTGSRAS
jgi:hypothetical protein